MFQYPVLRGSINVMFPGTTRFQVKFYLDSKCCSDQILLRSYLLKLLQKKRPGFIPANLLNLVVLAPFR